MTLVEDVLGYVFADYPDTFPGDVWLVNGADAELFNAGDAGGGTLDSTSLGRSRSDDLARANLVWVKPATGTPSAVGTGYDHKREDVVNVEIEALHEDQRGHVADHAAFQTLVENVKTAIASNREYPTTSTDARYYDLLFESESDRSENFRDYYAATFDVRFRGYEELP